MASAVYLEHFLDSIEGLPHELQRNFMLMKDLDQRAFDLQQETDKLAKDYLTSVGNIALEKRDHHLKQVKSMFQKSQEYSDDKVQLAVQTYEMVDKHIRKLDADLARFEAELNKQKERQSTDYDSASSISTPANRKRGREKNEKKKCQKGRSDDDGSKPGRKKSKGLQRSDSEGMLSPVISLQTMTPSDVLDMPVDPNEPTYCLCHQVSYGEMIGCDNPDCPIEWFHFQCVGLTNKPKGKWFCPKCTAERKKK